MKLAKHFPQIKELDDLRLLALSRIPRCAACSRLRALRATHENGVPLDEPLPPVPSGCDTVYCEPLAGRYAPEKKGAWGECGTPTRSPAGVLDYALDQLS